MPGITERSGVAPGGIVAWGVAVAAGAMLMNVYSMAPGSAGAPPVRWPGGTEIPLDRRCPTLLIFLHPQCPCSDASLDELAAVIDRTGGRVSAWALVYRPRISNDDWFPREFREAMAAIPGLSIAEDHDGVEAALFGIETSGHVLLFGPGGDLRFSGGITDGRGHRGESLGRRVLIARILDNRSPARPSIPEARGATMPVDAPVFGCSLLTPGTGPGA